MGVEKLGNGQADPRHLPYRMQPWFKNPGVPARTELIDTQLELIEWLVDPNRLGTQKTWAQEHGVNERTVSTWKKLPLFIDAWNTKLKELNVHPVRIQMVLDALWDKACQGDSKAASLYLQYVERFTPKQQIVVKDRAVADLSDAELVEYLGGREQ